MTQGWWGAVWEGLVGGAVWEGLVGGGLQEESVERKGFALKGGLAEPQTVETEQLQSQAELTTYKY